jgi:hypothetical protein
VWILCRWWDLTADYKEHLLRFLRGVEWDDLGEASRAASGVAGDYLREHTDPDLLEAVLDVYRSRDREVRRSVRQGAFYALVEAVGDDLREYLPLYEDIELDPPPDPTVITRALKRLVVERISQLKDRS